mgnify:CR=1 FL=1
MDVASIKDELIDLEMFIESFLETEDTLNFRIHMNDDKIKELEDINEKQLLNLQIDSQTKIYKYEFEIQNKNHEIEILKNQIEYHH